MTLEEQLFFVKAFLPEAWGYLQTKNDMRLPEFDDNDEVVSWRAAPQGSPKDPPHVELAFNTERGVAGYERNS